MNAQLNQQDSTDFKREHRYYVLKLSDLHGTVSFADLLYLDEIARKVADRRAQEGKGQREYLVIENDWPEFEPTWQAIEARVSGVPQQPPQLEVAGWRPKFPAYTTSLPPSSFTNGAPDQATVDYWKAQGIEIEYCYTGPSLARTEPDTAVRVCPVKDSVCGDRPASWCETCPKRPACLSDSAESDRQDALTLTCERPIAPKLLRKRCAQCHTCYKQREANAGCPRCAPGVQVSEAEFQQPIATPASSSEPIKYQPGEWYEAKDRDELEAFFRSRLPAIREAAREHGYAIGLHGSLRRDLDLIAAPWCDGASDKDVLAHAIAMAACGITREGPYQWQAKPLGRMAASLPCCWTSWHGEAGAGHIDLSVTPSTEPARVPMAWPEARDIGRYGDMHPLEHMRVGLDSDNDVYVSVWGEDGGAKVEFCNPGGGGGGSSRRTREALIALMVAMEADNADRPDKDWWARRNGSAQAKGGAA